MRPNQMVFCFYSSPALRAALPSPQRTIHKNTKIRLPLHLTSYIRQKRTDHVADSVGYPDAQPPPLALTHDEFHPYSVLSRLLTHYILRSKALAPRRCTH